MLVTYLSTGVSINLIGVFFSPSGIVREMAHKSDSMLKSISTTRLTPQHHLWYAPLSLCSRVDI